MRPAQRLLLTAILLLGFATAQPVHAGVYLTSDETVIIVGLPIGNTRVSLSLDLGRGALVGTVFSAEAKPIPVSCVLMAATDDPDIAKVLFSFDCYAEDEWRLLKPMTFSGAFFLP